MQGEEEEGRGGEGARDTGAALTFRPLHPPWPRHQRLWDPSYSGCAAPAPCLLLGVGVGWEGEPPGSGEQGAFPAASVLAPEQGDLQPGGVRWLTGHRARGNLRARASPTLTPPIPSKKGGEDWQTDSEAMSHGPWPRARHLVSAAFPARPHGHHLPLASAAPPPTTPPPQEWKPGRALCGLGPRQPRSFSRQGLSHA